MEILIIFAFLVLLAIVGVWYYGFVESGVRDSHRERDGD
jgi:hypothetical protein